MGNSYAAQIQYDLQFSTHIYETRAALKTMLFPDTQTMESHSLTVIKWYLCFWMLSWTASDTHFWIFLRLKHFDRETKAGFGLCPLYPRLCCCISFSRTTNEPQKSKLKRKISHILLDTFIKGVCVFVYACMKLAEGQSGEALERCLLSSMYSWGPACLRVWTVTCETRKKQDIAPLCLLKNTQRMACHYKTNPSACIPAVHQTLPVEQDVTQSGKGSYKMIYFMVGWLAICSEAVSSVTFISGPRKEASIHKFAWE